MMFWARIQLLVLILVLTFACDVISLRQFASIFLTGLMALTCALEGLKER